MYASGEDWEEILLMDMNLYLNFVMYCNLLVLLFYFSTARFNFSRISSESFGLRSMLKYFLSLWSQKGDISLS